MAAKRDLILGTRKHGFVGSVRNEDASVACKVELECV